MELLRASPASIQRAAHLLRRGGLVAFPTETVYGLGARADNPGALARLFEAKGRPTDHPLIVHLPSRSAVDEWARDVPRTAHVLAQRFWPGPLTIILHRRSGVLDMVTGGQDTIGLRVPSHPVALALLREVGCALAAPSANRFGRLSPTTAAHVVDELEDQVDAVLDGGPCKVGLESTIVDLSGRQPRLLRPGAITVEALAGVLGAPPARGGDDAPRAPGTLASHYAPRTPVEVVDAEHLGAHVREALASENGVVAVLALTRSNNDDARCRWHTMPADAASYARSLYASLRHADQSDCNLILVERPPEGPSWDAARDRLTRASGSPRTHEDPTRR